MDLGHTEGRIPEKDLQSIHPRLRLLRGNFRVGSFGKLPLVLASEAQLIAITS